MSRFALPLFVALLAVSLSFAAEVLMEVEFDLSTKQALEDGYTAGDTINAVLASEDIKWMRYFVPYVSGKQGNIRMRAAQFLFKSHTAWAEWTQENLIRLNALFDHFWVDSRRTIWTRAEPDVIPGGLQFPKVLRSEGMDAGYVYQSTFSIIPGKENEFKNEWSRAVPAFVNDLKSNPGFLERVHYVDQGFQPTYDHMVQYEFSSMQALSRSMHGKAYTSLVNAVSKYVDKSAVTILTPGADEALYWAGKGADREGFDDKK